METEEEAKNIKMPFFYNGLRKDMPPIRISYFGQSSKRYRREEKRGKSFLWRSLRINLNATKSSGSYPKLFIDSKGHFSDALMRNGMDEREEADDDETYTSTGSRDSKGMSFWVGEAKSFEI
ncbi:unnamed protein product [Caenorhabditis nigoni]